MKLTSEKSPYSNYTVKIVLNKPYTFENVGMLPYWNKQLQDYIFNYTLYVTEYGKLDQSLYPEIRESILRNFKSKKPKSIDYEKGVILNWRIKKVFQDCISILVHVELNETMEPIPPGTWGSETEDSIEVKYMRPTYNCTYESMPKTKIYDFIMYKYLGDFNDGFEMNKQRMKSCITSKNNTHNASVLDDLLEPNHNLAITMDLLRQIDSIGARIDMKDDKEAIVVKNNIALVVADTDPSRPVTSLQVATMDNDAFIENAFSILRQEDKNSSLLNTNKSKVLVQLPKSVGASSRRISFVVFRNNRAFQNTHYTINSWVISVNVENITQFDRNEFVNLHWSPFSRKHKRNESRSCTYWHFYENGGGHWSQDGCTFIQTTEPGILDTCRCNHQTHLAEILIPGPVFSERDASVLEILTIAGCCLSIMGLAVVGLTALLFRSWRLEFTNKIWLQLCISILLLDLCFFIVVIAKFDTYNFPCMAIGIALHYFVLVSFCWMLVAAVLSYRKIVLIFSGQSSHKLLKAGAFAWGSPCLIVGALLAVDFHSYAKRFEEKIPAGAFCYPSGLAMWLAVFAPISIILFANWTFFGLIIHSLRASAKQERYGHTTQSEASRCASISCVLAFLFGLPWVFGECSFHVIGAYFFTITATYQGFILFLLLIVVNKNTRHLWLHKLKVKHIW